MQYPESSDHIHKFYIYLSEPITGSQVTKHRCQCEFCDETAKVYVVLPVPVPEQTVNLKLHRKRAGSHEDIFEFQMPSEATESVLRDFLNAILRDGDIKLSLDITL